MILTDALMSQLIKTTTQNIKDNINLLQHKKATVGFDGCIDTLVYLIKNKCMDKQEVTHFADMTEFGRFVGSKGGKSCSIEYDMKSQKIGGNGPLFANVFGINKVKTNLIGTLGYPQIEDAFSSLSERCIKYSYGEAQKAMALEFTDGKVFLSPCHQLSDDAWKLVKRAVGEGKLKEVFLNTDLLAMLNWSELTYASDLWENLFDYIYQYGMYEKEKHVIFDFADCSRNKKEDKLKVLEIVSRFTKYRTTILSTNENEALDLYSSLGLSGAESIEQVAEGIAEQIDIDVLVVHTRKESAVITQEGSWVCKTIFQSKPMISTGGGDNFNAGFSLGLLMGLSYEACALLANATSGYYVSNGRSPNTDELMQFMSEWYLNLIDIEQNESLVSKNISPH